MSTPYKMKGSSLYGHGNSSPLTKTTKTTVKNTPAENLLKAVPNEKAYNELSDLDKKGFDVAAKKAGLPTKPKK